MLLDDLVGDELVLRVTSTLNIGAVSANFVSTTSAALFADGFEG